MTAYYKQPTWTIKHKNLNGINSICSVHDIHCMCNNPLQHTILGIIEQEPSLKFNKEDSTKIQKCLTTGDATGQDVVDGFGDGELESLFAEDFGDEKEDATR